MVEGNLVWEFGHQCFSCSFASNVTLNKSFNFWASNLSLVNKSELEGCPELCSILKL